MKEKDNGPCDFVHNAVTNDNMNEKFSFVDDMGENEDSHNSCLYHDILLNDITENDIYEGNSGIYTLPCEEIIPEKAECIHHTKSFEFTAFKSKDTKEIYIGIKVISYHSGELKISLNMLEKIVNLLKNRYQ